MLVGRQAGIDVFGPGQHRLETRNLPILSTILGWKHGFDSPFKAEVYFVTTRQLTELKWGTPNPVIVRDPDFGPVRVRAFGTFTLRAVDPRALIQELVGTDGHFASLFPDAAALADAIDAMPADVAEPLLHADFAHTSLYQELERVAGMHPNAGWERIHPAIPTDEERKAGVEPHPFVDEVDQELLSRVTRVLENMVKFHAYPLVSTARERPRGPSDESASLQPLASSTAE